MNKPTITVFEHQSLKVGDDKGLTKHHLEKFQKYHADGENIKYFSLIYNGIKFNQHVGVIQVGGLTIEILPKIDENNDEEKWRNILINMLHVAGILKYNTSNAALKIKNNSILDLYFDIFLSEVEYLLHSGLIKKYRKNEDNQKALKGNILFGKHIQKNLVHKEQLYVKHNTYDIHHDLHCIFYKTLVLLKNINNKSALQSRIGSLLLNFPEMSDIKITENLFNNVKYNRKNEHYQKAVDIAKLLLLNYHPDIQGGRNDIIALMFDMNLLWEKFVYKSLYKHNDDNNITIHSQQTKRFWNEKVNLRPDILIKINNSNIVLDTKWKIFDTSPSSDDLQQMYAYADYFAAENTALVYPSYEQNIYAGKYHNPLNNNDLSNKKCSIIKIPISGDVKEFQKSISACIDIFMNKF